MAAETEYAPGDPCPWPECNANLPACVAGVDEAKSGGISEKVWEVAERLLRSAYREVLKTFLKLTGSSSTTNASSPAELQAVAVKTEAHEQSESLILSEYADESKVSHQVVADFSLIACPILQVPLGFLLPLESFARLEGARSKSGAILRSDFLAGLGLHCGLWRVSQGQVPFAGHVSAQRRSVALGFESEQ